MEKFWYINPKIISINIEEQEKILNSLDNFQTAIGDDVHTLVLLEARRKDLKRVLEWNKKYIEENNLTTTPEKLLKEILWHFDKEESSNLNTKEQIRRFVDRAFLSPFLNMEEMCTRSPEETYLTNDTFNHKIQQRITEKIEGKDTILEVILTSFWFLSSQNTNLLLSQEIMEYLQGIYYECCSIIQIIHSEISKKDTELKEALLEDKTHLREISNTIKKKLERYRNRKEDPEETARIKERQRKKEKLLGYSSGSKTKENNIEQITGDILLSVWNNFERDENEEESSFQKQVVRAKEIFPLLSQEGNITEKEFVELILWVLYLYHYLQEHTVSEKYSEELLDKIREFIEWIMEREWYSHEYTIDDESLSLGGAGTHIMRDSDWVRYENAFFIKEKIEELMEEKGISIELWNLERWDKEKPSIVKKREQEEEIQQRILQARILNWEDIEF